MPAKDRPGAAILPDPATTDGAFRASLTVFFAGHYNETARSGHCVTETGATTADYAVTYYRQTPSACLS